MAKKKIDASDEDRRSVRGRLLVWDFMLHNAEGHLATALHYIDNHSSETVHWKYAVGGCINTAVMRYCTISRKGYSHQKLIRANGKVHRTYWEEVKAIAFSPEERQKFEALWEKINQYRDNFLAHSNAEHMKPIGYDEVQAMSPSGGIQWSRAELEFWLVCTGKLTWALNVVSEKIRSEETTKPRSIFTFDAGKPWSEKS